MAGKLSPNCMSVLEELTTDVVLVTRFHTLTLAALLSRGACELGTQKGKPGIYVTATQAGIELWNWMYNAKFINYREEALPAIQGAKGE